LSVGAPVMCLRNIDQKRGLVNGFRGRVVSAFQKQKIVKIAPDKPGQDGSTEPEFICAHTNFVKSRGAKATFGVGRFLWRWHTH
jgi:hypothetical protein